MTQQKRKSAGRSGAADRAKPEARRAIALIKKYYRIGERALGRSADINEQNPESIERFVKNCGLGSDTIRKATVLAEKYTPSEQEELLTLRDDGGRPLGWAKVRSLLRLPSATQKDRVARAALQKRAVAEGWSLRELNVRILDRQGLRTSQGGRRFASPRTAQDALRRLVEQCELWLRFCAGIRGVEDAALQGLIAAVPPGEESAALGDLLREASGRLSGIEAKAHEMKNQLAKAERKLKRRPARSDEAAPPPAAKTGAPKAKPSRKRPRGRSAK